MMGNTSIPVFLQREGLDPAASMAQVREGKGVERIAVPLVSDGEGFLVTRYDDVRAVLADSTAFPIAPTEFTGISETETAELRDGQLLDMNASEHTRLRRLLTPEFTVRRINRLEPRIVEIVGNALETLESAGSPADLVSNFALPIPSLVICELLGVPYEDREEFQERSRELLEALDIDQVTRAARQERAYMATLVGRAQADPGDDLLGMLIREHGDAVRTGELIGVAALLLVAGHETTANMLALGTLALLGHPEQLARLRANPDQIDGAIEELLRWLSVVNTGAMRRTTGPVHVAGHTIPAGAVVVVALPSANRDPGFVDNPDQLDLGRSATRHIAFGHGVHHCIGAPLARMEMRIAFPALLRRFPSLELAVPFEELQFRTHSFVHGLRSLPVAW